MFPNICFSFDKLLRRKKEDRRVIMAKSSGQDLQCHSIQYCSRKPTMTPPANFSLRSETRDRREDITERKREMANKVSNISHLIHRVASSCLTHQPASALADEQISDEDDEQFGMWDEESEGAGKGSIAALGRVREMEAAMADVFDAVSAVKRAYAALQDAHCPWDPDRMRAADAAVVAELRRLGRLRDRFRRRTGIAAAPLREAVAPYEAALDDLRRELKSREAEVESLKEKLLRCTTPRGSGKKGRIQYGKRVGCISGLGSPVMAAPTQELFESCMEEVKASSKSFTGHLLSLMRAARWDISAAVRSIVDMDTNTSSIDPHHAKHALESYVSRRLFEGFENETFYIEGSLTSLLRPAEFRRDCFSHFRDMRSMDPAELLGILPECHFGRFAGKKYLSVVHPRMEESLFGGAEQRRVVAAGGHPRTGFYGEFLRLAKAVWLLHLLAFALDPAPSHFEATKGGDFHPDYMESVVRFTGGRVPAGSVVGFSVGPGFKLANGSVVRARVYLVRREPGL